MKLVLQIVTHARVEIEGSIYSEMKGPGILALVGFGQNDTEEALLPALKKTIELRVFPNEDGRLDLSLLDIKGNLCLVPQFTLYADTSKGRRPDFFSAKPPIEAQALFNTFCSLAKDTLGNDKFFQGKFGANMQVSLTNDGPMTILLEI